LTAVSSEPTTFAVNCSDWADCRVGDFGDTDTRIPVSGFSNLEPSTDKLTYGREHRVVALPGTVVPVGAVLTPLHADSRNKDKKEQTESRNRMTVL